MKKIDLPYKRCTSILIGNDFWVFWKFISRFTDHMHSHAGFNFHQDRARFRRTDDADCSGNSSPDACAFLARVFPRGLAYFLLFFNSSLRVGGSCCSLFCSRLAGQQCTRKIKMFRVAIFFLFFISTPLLHCDR